MLIEALDRLTSLSLALATAFCVLACHAYYLNMPECAWANIKLFIVAFVCELVFLKLHNMAVVAWCKRENAIYDAARAAV